MSDQLTYKRIEAVEVYCTDCGKPYSHHPATVEVSVFGSMDEAREHINRTSLWAAGIQKVICGACLIPYTRHGSKAARDIREQLRSEKNISTPEPPSARGPRILTGPG